MDTNKSRLVLTRIEQGDIPAQEGNIKVVQLPDFLDGASVVSHTVGWSLDGAAILSVLCDSAPTNGWPN